MDHKCFCKKSGLRCLYFDKHKESNGGYCVHFYGYRNEKQMDFGCIDFKDRLEDANE